MYVPTTVADSKRWGEKEGGEGVTYLICSTCRSRDVV